ncbi:MAG: hypothetical protein KME57_03930 [Scytonema hyalinum WJT4-NPBG1]|nr:hypothetical protein [Scytonema hyalinum WJT4-NPBG1]
MNQLEQFLQTVSKQRVERAKLLLSKTDLTSTNIALQVGNSCQSQMTSYLRLCCLAIRKLRQKPGVAGKLSLNEAFDDSYSHLLQALCNHNPERWRRCWSRDRGILKSDDPTINKLLQSLEYFVEIYTCKYSSNQKLR